MSETANSETTQPVQQEFATVDGNEAVARIAYALNEVIAIYPITPASPMAEWADTWSTAGRPNLWGTVPTIVEMQSEGGVAGAVHGALQTGALTTTFTASQGLLLMLPNLFKIAGELTPTVLHVAARSVAAQALSIFGDHSDVMAARGTGFGMLCAASVQEAQDFAAIATAATLRSRIPFMHFFDGFRTSHEIQKITLLPDAVLRSLIDPATIIKHRSRSLSPDHPVIRGTAQNPDVFFQARETVNPFYSECANIVQTVMDEFADLTGRRYQPFEYYGADDAARVIILMGSGCETVQATVDAINAAATVPSDRVGVLKVRLYRPFDPERFIAALPPQAQSIAVLDRTKEPGSTGEPLYMDVLAALLEQRFTTATGGFPTVVGGRYGLSSKEFTPAMVKGVFDHLAQSDANALKNHFTIGIQDDVSHTSLQYDPNYTIEPDDVIRAVFYGLGSDGTVGANKNSIKIIGEQTDNYVQGYFVYDSKKSGSVTVSHLRFGPQPLYSTYLISQANFIACHQWEFLAKLDVLESAIAGTTFLINAPYSADVIWSQLPPAIQQQIRQKQLRVYGIDASKVAREAGMGGRINTVMQVCFFALAGVLPREQAIAAIETSIRKTYSKKGEEIVRRNLEAVSQTLENLYEIVIPAATAEVAIAEATLAAIGNPISEQAPAFVHAVLGKMLMRQGDALPVSALPVDGTYPTGTSQWEKRNIAQSIPVWDQDVCVQCGKCVMVCPHAVIRSKVYSPEQLNNAPSEFKSIDARDSDWQGLKYTLQVAAEDCTGCGICVDVCPVKNKSQPRLKAINMTSVYVRSNGEINDSEMPQQSEDLRQQERENWDFFLQLPNPDRSHLNLHKISHQQMQEPLFEFSGACAGCGETPYIKLVTQLFGDRLIVANATGCSSIYGGNLPTTPWTHNADGRGPAWSNSLFEDNAEFGLGFRVSLDQQAVYAAELLQPLMTQLDPLVQDAPHQLVQAILNAEQSDEATIVEQRDRVAQLKQWLTNVTNRLKTVEQNAALKAQIEQFEAIADSLVKKSVWLIGGDGWAYDIGYGGLDHVLASGRNVNILVLDTEVYSNTGGQMSKATPRAAVAKFAAGGKPGPKKDLGLMAMTYGNVYVGSVAMGARDEHTLKTFLEAESYDGPSLIIAYSHCIAHGIDMSTAMHHQKAIVDAGRWLLYRYDPRRAAVGENPLLLDSHGPKQPVNASLYAENRFKLLTRTNPDAAKQLLQQAQQDVTLRWQMYQHLAHQHLVQTPEPENSAQ
jgi:pyruvate-ferredoxin/flavodoxin oxidoreductase